MNNNQKEITVIAQEFPDDYIRDEEFRGQTTIIVKKEHSYEVLRLLKEDRRFMYDYLVDITSVDYLKAEEIERFVVIYNLYSYSFCKRLRLKVMIPENDPVVSSVYPLWKTAEWLEREVYDMFGIKFTGHPDLRRILTPDDFTGHPLRKDYPLKGRGERESFKIVK